MKPIEYKQLGTPAMRKECVRDHLELQRLFDQEWVNVMGFPLKSTEFIRDWQLRRIKELVKHAYETVPLYKRKYAAVGFNPSDLKSWEDFKELPMLTKTELIDAFPNDFISNRHNLEFTTRSSGSSGKFVTVAISPKAVHMDTIQGARQLIRQSGGKLKEDDTSFFIYTCPWWFSSINGKYPTTTLSTTTKPAEAIERIRQTRPKVLSVYPTYLTRLREEGQKLSRLGVESIIVHSEQSSPQHRRELSDFFEVPVLDEFSSEELTRISLECSNHKYHLEEDACYIEIVDPKTKRPLSNAQRGLVVGTNLLNEATPIIRYSQDDIASIIGNEDCECGSNFRVMSPPHGRIMDSIVLPNKDYVPASCFMDLAYNWYLDLGIPVHGLRYQIIQKNEKQVNIFLIPGSFKIGNNQLKIIRESMYQLLPREVEVNVRKVKEPPVNHTQKYRPVLSFVGASR